MESPPPARGTTRAILVFVMIILVLAAVVGLASLDLRGSAKSTVSSITSIDSPTIQANPCVDQNATSSSILSQTKPDVRLGSPSITMVTVNGSSNDLINSSLNGPGLTTIIGWEDWPVYVSSNITAAVSFDVGNVGPGLWAEVIPSCLHDVGPSGATATLRIAPARSASSGDTRNVSLFVNAGEAGGPTAREVLPPIVQHGNIAFIHSPLPLIQGTAIGGNYTDASYSNNPPYSNTTELEGVVYDPLSSNASRVLSVAISALGLMQNGSLVPIPSWMQVELPEPFVLNASVPYYFHIGISTNPAHVGTYTISLQELENGQPFTDYLKIETCNIPAGVACP